MKNINAFEMFLNMILVYLFLCENISFEMKRETIALILNIIISGLILIEEQYITNNENSDAMKHH